MLVSAGAGVGVGFAAHAVAPPFPPLPHEVTATPSAEVTPTASAAPAPVETAAVSASAPAPPAVEPSVCMKAMFPDETFTAEAPLDFVCEETNPIKGAGRVKEVIVKAAGKTTSPGMKEWAVLGFYEMAAYGVMRGRCCPSDEPPDVVTFGAPKSPEGCEPLNDALTKIAAASKQGTSDEDASAATKAFADAVKCIVKMRTSKSFGGHPAPSGLEATVFAKTFDRARGVQPKAD